MEETKRRVKKAALIIGGTIIIFVVITAWISGITSHFDESNTYVYEGALSYVDRYNTRELRWGGLSITSCILQMGKSLRSIPTMRQICWTLRQGAN